MSPLPNTYVEYSVPFQGDIVKMVGRPNVVSDREIIGVIFQQEMFAMGQWEQTKYLNKYLLDKTSKGLKPLLIDAGANIGAASLYFNKIYSGLKTVAIEPDNENAKLAMHNLSGLDVQVIQGALGNKTGVMYINDIDFAPIAYRVGESGNKPVSSHTITSILAAFGTNYFPFILKIDIEGGEDNVFSGNAQWLDLFPVVIIELHDWMLPFKNSSKNFYRNISWLDFDVLNRGENTFCFNKRLLAAELY
jgi:FkbM family methyltransferase